VTVASAAGLERRFAAFLVDRLLVWSVLGAVGLLVWRLTAAPWAVVGAVLAAGLVVTAVYVVLVGRTGVTPGKGLVGLRVVGEDDGAPIGVGAAGRRLVLIGAATLPTLGLGAAVLAAGAALDPGHRRRGLHDRMSGAVVVDARPVVHPVPEPVPAPPPRLVNLTTLRLAPPPPDPVPAVVVPAGPSGPRPDATRSGDPAPGPGWRVTFDTGESLVVEGLVVLGRGPEPRSGEQVSALVPLRSTDMSLSKTHAQVQPAPDGSLVVMDRGSTNGSTVVRRGVSRSLTAGRPLTLLDRDTVRFGDRTMVVSRT